MGKALLELETYWRAMPPEWTEVETGLSLASIKRLLWRFQTDPRKFWEAL